MSLLGFDRENRGVIFWQRRSTLSLVFSYLAVVVVVIALTTALVPYLPRLLYLLRPDTSSELAQVLARPAVTFGDLLAAAGEQEVDTFQPPLDPTLPEGAFLNIQKIGVMTAILEAPQDRYEEALLRGVWRVPDFGTPAERRLPTILVAHRFGYLSWSDSYRRANSFYNLPKLGIGDRVEIIWQQRRYVYQIYGGDESELMQDYTADLTLYTCKILTSPVRIFRFARLVRD